MKLKLNRIFKGKDYTIGHLYIDGEYFCDTLEDRVRDLLKEGKIPAETAIPAGTYNVTVTSSPRFKRMLPRLVNVPQFEGILIHRGNTAKDSSGCILVGENKRKGMVINSTYHEERLVERLQGQSNIIIEVV